jgi:DNA repair exonuclease SbcCD nuclease subunit
VLRVLHLTDTHLGHDLPVRPRVDRVRRGEDFFTNTALALAAPADLYVHTGDLFFRSKVPPSIVDRAYALLHRAAERAPVVVIPGNHERSALPPSLLLRHPRIHVIDRPRVVRLEAGGADVAIAGFPFVREIGPVFAELSERLARKTEGADLRLLGVHQAVDGARVAAGLSGNDFTFRASRPDVLDPRACAPGFDAVLVGHIHRRQVITAEPRGCSRGIPFLHPGSIERTSFAEMGETKGYAYLELDGSGLRTRFVDLPARPAVRVALEDASELGLAEALARLPPRAWARLDAGARWRELTAARIRRVAPADACVEVSGPPRELRRSRPPSAQPRASPSPRGPPPYRAPSPG